MLKNNSDQMSYIEIFDPRNLIHPRLYSKFIIWIVWVFTI